jgi:hypothetical protein
MSRSESRDAEWVEYLQSVGLHAEAESFIIGSMGMSFLGKHKSGVTDYTGKYVIWSPTSQLTINYVYESRPEAIKVAYEMAQKNQGQQFIVLKAVGVAQTQRVEFVDLEKAKETQPRVRGRFARKGILDPLGADANAYSTPGTGQR